MMTLAEVREKLGDRLRIARDRKRWSYAEVAAEIKTQGGKVSAKTVENIEKALTNYEFSKLYWIARVLNLPLGEVFEFTVEDEDRRAHTMLGAILRRGGQDAKQIKDTLRYIAKK